MALPGSTFKGFDAGGAADKRLTGIPASFFTQLLPQVTNPSELKVLLHFMYLAGQKRGDPKWVGYWELEGSPELLAGLKKPGDPRPPQEHLREGLELAVTRGSLLRLMVANEPEEFTFGGDFEPVTVMWFLLNTSANRDFVTGLESGKIALENTTLVEGLDPWEWALPPEQSAPTTMSSAKETIERWKELRLTSGRDDIYNLYEQNIGVLTPLISDKLREAEKLYPAEWIEYAFEQAVTYNRRNWAYISRILENWATEGRIQDGHGNEREGQTARGFASRGGGNERGNLAIAGAGTPGAKSENSGPPTGPGRHSPPNKSGRSGPRPAPGNAEIDFTKYTTGKYAYLTGERQRPRPAAKNGDE